MGYVLIALVSQSRLTSTAGPNGLNARTDMSRNETFNVGDTVDILSAFHLPKSEHITHTGVIERITHQSSDGTPLYWIAGRLTAVTAVQLRKAVR